MSKINTDVLDHESENHSSVLCEECGKTTDQVVKRLGFKIEDLDQRIGRYAKRRARALDMSRHLSFKLSSIPSALERKHARDCSTRLEDCGAELVFRYYLGLGETRLISGQFCQLGRLCPLCAARKASKLLARYLVRFIAVRQANGELQAYLMTLTVRNGPDLIERLKHLKQGVRKLRDRRKQKRSGNGRGRSVFSKVEGGVGTYEVSNQGRNWHPHLHFVALTSEPLQVCHQKAGTGHNCLDCDRRCELSKEWHKTTGDSWIVDVRPFNEEDAVKSFCEVFKYSLKFGDMSLDDNWTAHLALRGERMAFSIGNLYGVDDDPATEDEPLTDEELEYVDLIYRYLEEEGCYSLVEERHCCDRVT